MVTKGNRTLKDILDVILYENPSTQDEIADKLGITRRYVTQLLQPLVKEEVVKRAYIIDLKKYEEVYGEDVNSPEYSGNLLIKNMLQNMSDHVKSEVETAFRSVVENDKDIAEEALQMDYATNNLFEKVRFSVETIVNIDPHSKFSKVAIYNEVAYDLERIGDYSGHVAKFAINDDLIVDEDVLKYLKKMHKVAQKSIDISMDAFINGKLGGRGNIMDNEEKMHDLQKAAMNSIAFIMADTSFDDTEHSNYYLYLSRVVKAFERIGDICVEIMDTAAEFHKDIPRPTIPRTFRE
jgi:phosphate transport system protein